MSKNLPANASIGASGEHLVLSQLLKMDYIAGLAPQNTKDYDLIVSSSDGTRLTNIQVKTALSPTRPKNPSKNKWMISKKNEVFQDNLIYSFVHILQDSNDFRVYNIPAKIVSSYAKISHGIWLKLPGLNNKPHKENPIRIIAADALDYFTTKDNRTILSNFLEPDEIQFLLTHRFGWMDQFSDNWDIFNY